MKRALELLERAVALAERQYGLNHPEMVYHYLQLGRAYADNGGMDMRAVNVLEKAVGILEAENLSLNDLFSALAVLAECHFRLQNEGKVRSIVSRVEETLKGQSQEVQSKFGDLRAELAQLADDCGR
mmetsp:Transcript_5978/g.14458  ORF Transcript_5978/g.14458 Transcript_5978/m.14458 type:complete len:127 (+) Transcript_5978:247-627(+)